MDKKHLWLKLDNAAKIYPAAKRRTWVNLFRLSATMSETVDPEILKSALKITAKRFPYISVAVKRGLFWYYLEETDLLPEPKKDGPYPLMKVKFREIRKCAFRVLYYDNRIAVEFFHSLTDGNGGLVFLKTLIAEYILQKYGKNIECTNGVLSRTESPDISEIEDSFLKYSGEISKSRSEPTAFKLSGTKEENGFINLITGIIPAEEILTQAKKYGVSLTVFLVSIMIECIIEMQNKKIQKRKKQRPVKILVPVNLRKFFPSKSLRNFVMFVTPGVDPRLGDWSFEEILNTVHHQMGTGITAKEMAGRIAANVNAEKMLLLKIMPLFIKNLAMKAVYNMVGEKKSCLAFSNLGVVEVPKEMIGFIKRFDFILGVQATTPCNCGVLSYNGNLYINFIRDIKESELERKFFTRLRKLGIHVKIESNQKE